MRQFASPFPVINIIREAIPRSVSIRGDIKSFSDENGEMNGNITFTDGTVLSGIDHVIFCTGFASNIPFFGELQVPEGGENTLKKFENIQESQILADYKNPLNVYREIFLASDPTVAFVGMKADFTLHPHFAIQSEAIARVWTGNAYLPETSSMYTSILEGTPLCMTTDTNLYEKLRNIPYIAWVNTHAKLIKDNGGQELPEMENYRDSFVEELNKYQKIWLEISEKNIQQTKEKIRKEKIKTKVYAY
jgi:hypothetical protein